MNTLPLITQQDIDTAASDAGGLIHLLTERYREILSTDTTGTIQASFTIEQNILMAFEVLDGQVSHGGFIQLIENGYGAYIFDTPLVHYLHEWGLTHIASLIDKARILYTAKREILEREKTLEEFARLYAEHPEFDILDQDFVEVIQADKDILRSYILSHLTRFASIG